LKDVTGLPSLDERMAACRALARHPRIVVTDIEAQIGARYTYDTLRYLTRRCPGVKLVWIMGADNLRGFHCWGHWREISKLVPIAVIDRPGATLEASGARAAKALWLYRISERDAPLLAGMKPPAFLFLHARRSAQSSTALRAARKG
jgi:nicotinate-nucleotide adenylyltransferase